MTLHIDKNENLEKHFFEIYTLEFNTHKYIILKCILKKKHYLYF